ncbi:MAG: DedA family protein [Gemmataceae bacterium]
MEWIQSLLLLFKNLDEHLNALASGNLFLFYAILFLIIFAETGLVVTPFLPGDSLLFALGAMATTPTSPIHLYNSTNGFLLLMAILITAAILGDALNYAIGFRVGPKVFRYEKSVLFNQKHLLRAQNFYEKHGNKTIILARFVPIVRTFAPFVAGIGKMQYRQFALYNVVGGITWVTVCVISGWLFGELPFVKKNFELVVLAIIFISIIPMAVELILEWKTKSSKTAS